MEFMIMIMIIIIIIWLFVHVFVSNNIHIHIHIHIRCHNRIFKFQLILEICCCCCCCQHTSPPSPPPTNPQRRCQTILPRRHRGLVSVLINDRLTYKLFVSRPIFDTTFFGTILNVDTHPLHRNICLLGNSFPQQQHRATFSIALASITFSFIQLQGISRAIHLIRPLSVLMSREYFFQCIMYSDSGLSTSFPSCLGIESYRIYTNNFKRQKRVRSSVPCR